MICLALALAMSLCAPAAGQSGNEGSIEGTVADTSGAVIPGARVAARNVDTTATFRAATDERGMFRFLVVPVGRYAVSAEHNGFARLVQEPVVVSVGGRVSLRMVLDVRRREEEVMVAGGTPLVETTRTAFASTIDQRSVASLPQNGRNFLTLALLTPAIASTGGTLNGAFYNVGGQISMNSLVVDGADHNGFLNQPVGSALPNRYLVSEESIQEFRVNTVSYSAEFGRAGTAVIDVVTKSGTNQFRGSAFWYYRDRSLNATDYFDKLDGKPKAPYHSNQFGGAAGGPLSRDRLFFFASYDGQRRSEPAPVRLVRPGNFTVSSNPEVGKYEQTALDYLNERANPYLRTFDQNVTLGKLDWRISDSHSLTGQYNRHRLRAPNMLVGLLPQQAWEHNGTEGQVADTFNGSLTSILSSRTVNAARVSYVSTHTPQTGNTSKPEARVFQSGQPVLLVGRLPTVADNGVSHVELADTVSLTRGKHAPKMGGSVLVERAQFLSTLNFYGAYLFNSLESFGHSLAGDPPRGGNYVQAFSGEGKAAIEVHPDYVELAAFAQDAWRVRPTFTLDLGVRYDVQMMRPSNVRNPAPELLAAGVDTSFIPTDSNNVAPRGGFAWSPGGHERVVVRGGYGLFYPRLAPGTAVRPFFQNGITAQTRTFYNRDMPTYPNTKCGAPDDSGAVPTCPALTQGAGKPMVMAIARTYEQPVVQQGSFGIEYALGRDLSVAVTYLRVQGDHLMHWQDVNLGEPQTRTIGIGPTIALTRPSQAPNLPTPQPLALRPGTTRALSYPQYPKTNESPFRPMAAFDRVFLLETNGHSSYHGLAVQVNERWSRNFQIAGSYTFGRVIDDNPTDGALNPGTQGGDAVLLSDSGDPGLDRGPGSYGQRHRLVLHGIWALDYASGLPQPARAILSDWEVSGVMTANSGFPYSPLLNSDLNGDGNQATDRTPGLGRNMYALPASAVVDARLSRTVRFNRVRVQVSGDAFNLFNRVNIRKVKTTQFSVSSKPADCDGAGTPCLMATSDFGRPTEAFDQRIVQISVRVSF